MMKVSELPKEKQKNLSEFVDITFCLKGDELQALDKQIPMTQELFDRCCDRLSEIGADNQFFQLLIDYPDFMVDRAERIEKEIELSNVNCPVMTDDDMQQGWNDLLARIERKKGKQI